MAEKTVLTPLGYVIVGVCVIVGVVIANLIFNHFELEGIAWSMIGGAVGGGVGGGIGSLIAHLTGQSRKESV